MTLDEALNYSLTKLWIVEQCNKIDTDCVGVVPIDRIFFRYTDATIDSELEIIPFGSVDRIVAEHIVSVHNESLGFYKSQKKRLEALQKLSDLDQELGLQ